MRPEQDPTPQERDRPPRLVRVRRALDAERAEENGHVLRLEGERRGDGCGPREEEQQDDGGADDDADDAAEPDHDAVDLDRTLRGVYQSRVSRLAA